MIATKITSIGNSKGIRIPKAFLDQLGIIKEVFLQIQNDVLIITPKKTTRKKWSEDAKKLAAYNEPLYFEGNNSFDTSEWEWK